MAKRSRPVLPHAFIDFKGERWIEVEWPSDGRYDIGYQLAQETERNDRRYMGLFEAARFHIRAAESRVKENKHG